MKNTASFDSLEAYSSNPCIICTEKLKAELASCLATAGNNQVKIDACNAEYATKWTNECGALCT